MSAPRREAPPALPAPPGRAHERQAGDAQVKVSLSRHGGLAAGIFLRRPPLELDGDRLAPELRAELQRLIDAAKADPGNDGAGPGLARDAMSYTITIEDDGDTLVLKGRDADESPAFHALRTWVEEHAGR